jgi:hypothetical protein
VLSAGLAVGLALLTFLIYLPVIGYTWVNYDADGLVTTNPKAAPVSLGRASSGRSTRRD